MFVFHFYQYKPYYIILFLKRKEKIYICGVHTFTIWAALSLRLESGMVVARA